MGMKEEILLLIKKLYKKEEIKSPFKKPILLNFLNIEEIAENLHSESYDILWDEITATFEKINNLRKKEKISS